MSAIVIVDTSVLLNILDVPGRNESRAGVLTELGKLIETSDHLFIPMAAIVEVGNHIAQLGNGAQRRAAAERFIAEVRKALADEAPWKPINFPSNQEVLGWLDVFPDAAMQGLGMGDLSIKKEWEDLCAKYSMSRVRVWTLDKDLAGLDRAGVTRRRVTP
ncbi:type II toxin-antitoxin system VapC family toxin [Roseateles sp. LYH14W]|uniref:Type II toxin-antitoxin system VapC family toxin n=1 Tax=Pelomonas parva TaxID=3299032 RepID=A0ABW7F785_9BURK